MQQKNDFLLRVRQESPVADIRPWEHIEALGMADANNLNYFGDKNMSILIAGHQVTYIKENDCVENEILFLEPHQKISIVVLSGDAWQPPWRAISTKQPSNGNNMVTGQDEKYYNVLFLLEREPSRKLWLSEGMLSKFLWPSL
jgi:hypothetical protein